MGVLAHFDVKKERCSELGVPGVGQFAGIYYFEPSIERV